MRLLRFRHDSRVWLGALVDGRVVALDGMAHSYPTMLALIAGGEAALAAVRAEIATTAASLAVEAIELLAPVERPGKYLAIGMNYAKHVAEAAKLGVEAPKQQFWFNKQTSCLAGPYDAIEPGVTERLDYEVELVAVIGTPAKGVAAADALAHVFGYTIGNDVSARDWQMHSPTFTMGKSFDTHGPIGPWIVTADEVPDPQALDLRCLVNGEVRQASNTGQMIHKVADQIAYLSTAFTLEPGDLLCTGTPEGVGAGMTPPTFLRPGDVVRCEIDGIGAIENRVSGG